MNQAKHIDRDGKTLFVNIRISPSEYQGRKVLLVTTSDITKRLEAEQRKRLQPLRKRVTQAEAKLEALQRTRDELDRQLAYPKIYNDQNKRKLQECLLEKSDMDKQCCAVENEWILASEELDDLSADLPKS